MNLTAEKYYIMIHFTISRNSQTHEAKACVKIIENYLKPIIFHSKKEMMNIKRDISSYYDAEK